MHMVTLKESSKPSKKITVFQVLVRKKEKKGKKEERKEGKREREEKKEKKGKKGRKEGGKEGRKERKEEDLKYIFSKTRFSNSST